MQYLAVTTCNAEQWQQYGRVMATTFCRYWPAAVPLWLYAEGFAPASDLPIDQGFDLDFAAPWLADFKDRYSDQKYNGGPNSRDYRRDAVRFAHKVAAIGAAAEQAECDVLIWIDADTVTHERVTTDWLDSLFPAPATIAWLDREHVYPECGFLMFRMPDALVIIERVIGLYQSGKLFNLTEWHDSYVFQHVVTTLESKGKITVHSLSGPEGRKHIGHPWVSSRLAEKLDHLKGETRKSHGRSLLSDIRKPRPEAYWR